MCMGSFSQAALWVSMSAGWAMEMTTTILPPHLMRYGPILVFSRKGDWLVGNKGL